MITLFPYLLVKLLLSEMNGFNLHVLAVDSSPSGPSTAMGEVFLVFPEFVGVLELIRFAVLVVLLLCPSATLAPAEDILLDPLPVVTAGVVEG
jgi:hypothetical protein